MRAAVFAGPAQPGPGVRVVDLAAMRDKLGVGALVEDLAAPAAQAFECTPSFTGTRFAAPAAG